MLHCDDCTNNKAFDCYKNHRHLGKHLYIENFSECPGAGCCRCRQFKLDHP